MVELNQAVAAAIKDVLIEPRCDQINGLSQELADAAIEAYQAWQAEYGPTASLRIAQERAAKQARTHKHVIARQNTS